jgi:hypothetical protein
MLALLILLNTLWSLVVVGAVVPMEVVAARVVF